MTHQKYLSRAIRLALLVGAGVTMIGGPVFAQEDEAEAKTLDKVEVTGSRIKRANVEGATPVTVIDRKAIELSGDINVSDFLRNITFNSFGSFRPQSGSSAQSFAGLSLRGLGSARTLILIDGRRAPTNPSTGQGQDLNSIPLAAVERFEILSDGASAIYGSDAIGGVVNVITRKDYEGVEIKYGISAPERKGGDTEEGSVLFGAAGERGQMLAGASYSNRDIVFQRDRPWSTGGVSTFSNNYMVALPSPGSFTGFRPGGFANVNGNGAAVPGGCNEPNFALNGAGTTCFFDFTAVAADEASIDQSSAFARGSFQINDDWTTYLNTTITRLESFGRYAPVPAVVFVPANTPNNPTNDPLFLRHRFAALGNRDTSIDAQTYDINLGFQGRVADRVDLDFGLRRSESVNSEIGRNFLVIPIAEQFIADGSYDIFNPSQNPADVLNAMKASIPRRSRTLLEEVYLNSNFDLFEMAGGTANAALGGEFRRDTYEDVFDSLSEAGVIGGSAGNSAGGGRNARALYAEVLLPVLSNLEFDAAIRYDRYSDFGSATSPKVSMRFQPFESLTLRASWGEGFRAPTLDILTQKDAFSADTVRDPQTCLAFGQPATCSTQIDATVVANPNLGAEDSETWTAGAVWDATSWLSLTLDYFDIEITNQINSFSSGNLLFLESTGEPLPPGLSITRNPSDGQILNITRGFGNRGSIETAGADFNLRTRFGLGDYGDLANNLQISWTRNFRVDGGRNLIDDPSVPRYRATLNNVYSLGDFSFSWDINYIHGTKSSAFFEDQSDPDIAALSQRLGAWTTHDLQVNWNAPWNGKITLGVQNIANKDPILDPLDPTGRGFDFNLYDGYGRVPYVRYTQSF